MPRRHKDYIVPKGHKCCSRCKNIRPITMFCKDTDGIMGLRSQCRVCDQEHCLRWRHGMLLEDYQKQFNSQNGKCAICRKQERSGKLLAADHNHRTRKYRGLLCEDCNRAIGLFNESVENLASAAAYLQFWEKEHEGGR